MSEPRFTLKPSLVNALLPVFLRRLWRFAVGGALAFGVFWLLNAVALVPLSEARLLFSVVSVVLLASVISIKHRMIKLHNTKYLFYDTHVVEEVMFVTKRRRSMPYKQIAKVTNDSSLWNRVTGASDIILHASRHGGSHDLVLHSIKGSDDVEHRIYGMLGATATAVSDD